MTARYDLDRHIRSMRHFLKSNTLLSDAACRLLPKIPKRVLEDSVREIIQEFQNEVGLSMEEKVEIKRALNKAGRRKFDLPERYRKLSSQMTKHYLDEPHQTEVILPKETESNSLQVHTYEEPIPEE